MTDKPAIAKKTFFESSLFLPVLFVMAFIVRVIYLGRADLWEDEMLFVNRSTPPITPPQIMSMIWEQFVSVTHFPLPRIAQNLFLWLCKPFSDDLLHNVFLQRMPAVIWGSLTVVVFHKLARRVLTDISVWIATGMMTFFMFPVFFAREAYYYSPLMFFSTATLYLLAGYFSDQVMSARSRWLLFLSSFGMVYSHMTGTVLQLILWLGVLVSLFIIGRDDSRRRNVSTLSWLLFLPLLIVAPYFIKMFSNPSPFPLRNPPAYWVIVYDVLGKLFLGNHVLPSVLAIAVFIMGAVFLLRSSKQPIMHGYMLVTGTVSLLVLAYLQHKSKYLVRYFSALAPLMYLFFAAGLGSICRLLAMKARNVDQTARRAGISIMAILVAFHVFILLPVYYRLPAKGVDYGSVAEWLTNRLQPGQAYVMESAYELRWVSGHYPTPDLVGAAPYTHANGPAEGEKLRGIQRAFLLQFPEAPWIESARHGINVETGLSDWDWPHQYFRQRVDIKNEPLRKLSGWRFWMQSEAGKVDIRSLFTPIWYNTDEDIEAIAREEGRSVIPLMTGWRCLPIMRADHGRRVLYAHTKAGRQGVIYIKNITDEPVNAVITMEAALAAGQGTYNIFLKGPGFTPLASAHPAGRFWTLSTPEMILEPGVHELEWGVSGSKPVDALYVRKVSVQK